MKMAGKISGVFFIGAAGSNYPVRTHEQPNQPNQPSQPGQVSGGRQ